MLPSLFPSDPGASTKRNNEQNLTYFRFATALGIDDPTFSFLLLWKISYRKLLRNYYKLWK